MEATVGEEGQWVLYHSQEQANRHRMLQPTRTKSTGRELSLHTSQSVAVLT